MVGLAAQMARVLDSLDPGNFPHKRWRDKKGVVHGVEARKFSGLAGSVTWVAMCSGYEPSVKKCSDAKTAVTCIACLGGV